MAGAAHDPAFAKKVGVPMGVASEFNKADARTGLLSRAERARGEATPKLAKGGSIDGCAERGLTKGKIS